jgi:hypothetical protein
LEPVNLVDDIKFGDVCGTRHPHAPSKKREEKEKEKKTKKNNVWHEGEI